MIKDHNPLAVLKAGFGEMVRLYRKLRATGALVDYGLPVVVGVMLGLLAYTSWLEIKSW